MAEEDLTKNASRQAGGQAAASPPASPWQAPPGQWQAPGPWQPASPWQSPYSAPGWPGQSSPWSAAAPYPSTGWGYQPAFWPGAYPPPGPVPGVRWAGLGARFGALVIDFIILVASFIALAFAISATGYDPSSSSESSPAVTVLSLVWWAFALTYHPACWYVFGASAGQKALGLRVARASDGQTLGIGGVLARFLIFATVTVLIPLGIISAFMASRDPYQRAWHDLVARSVVVGRG